MNKVILFGVDAACFDFLLPLLEKGELPHLKKLIDNGVSSNLESTIPPWTAPAWVSLYSGKNPGKHGIFDFFKCQPNYELDLVSSKDIHSKLIWNYLSEKKLYSIVINAPLTYPPQKIKGIVIPGYLAPENPECYPREILEELKKEIGDYRIYPIYEKNRKPEVVFKDYLKLIDMRRNASIYLCRKYDWDFMMVQFQVTDTIFHALYKQGKIDFSKVVLLYKKVDQSIGDILHQIKRKVNVIIASDHGIGKEFGWKFNINVWLKKHGLVKITKSKSINPLKNIKLQGLVTYKSKIFSSFIIQRILELGLRIPKAEKILSSSKLVFDFFGKHLAYDLASNMSLPNVDWTKSLAFCRSSNELGIRLNLKNHEAEYEMLSANLITKLSKLKDPDGKLIFEKALPREEVYKGPLVNNAPDIILIPREMNYQIGTSIINRMFEKTTMINHKMHGILIANGPDFKNTYLKETPKIVDIAPTVLHILNVPIDNDMDGRVLEIF